ncbi:MAG: preprotein translocase subunit YajC [bacterium]|nr:preprotein translocase subunit YajC [bacterium]MDE0131898.1 preprotein translocase subunit YajC [bacterium]MDE0501884.1 preprotein translocase subunit YajC [bacterium]MDE0601551.1 preprotein translocase subunit YajC [bacterium]
MIFAQESAGSPIFTWLVLGGFLLFFYFLLIRPQRKRARQQQELVANLNLGDQVQTIGGIMGQVRSVEEDSVVIELEYGSIRIAKRAIASKQAVEG